MRLEDRYQQVLDQIEDGESKIAEIQDDINSLNYVLKVLEQEWLKTHDCACELIGITFCPHGNETKGSAKYDY